MICLRCGYCCINYMVVIVDNPEIGIKEDNLISHEGNGMPCKHLVGSKKGFLKCNIHHYSWFKETPCAKHTQIETKNSLLKLFLKLYY